MTIEGQTESGDDGVGESGDDGLQHAACASIGTGHLESPEGTCEDAIGTLSLGDETVILVAADGVGSVSHGGVGAIAAIEEVLQCYRELLPDGEPSSHSGLHAGVKLSASTDDDSNDDEVDLRQHRASEQHNDELVASVLAARRRLEGVAEELCLPLEQLACTLTIVVVQLDCIHAICVGDGVVLYRPMESNRHMVLIGQGKEGLDAVNFTDTLIDSELSFRTGCFQGKASWVLASTDGVADVLIRADNRLVSQAASAAFERTIRARASSLESSDSCDKSVRILEPGKAPEALTYESLLARGGVRGSAMSGNSVAATTLMEILSHKNLLAATADDRSVAVAWRGSDAAPDVPDEAPVKPASDRIAEAERRLGIDEDTRIAREQNGSTATAAELPSHAPSDSTGEGVDIACDKQMVNPSPRSNHQTSNIDDCGADLGTRSAGSKSTRSDLPGDSANAPE